MLVFKNPIYIIGAYLAAYAHKKFIKKMNLQLDVILMLDQSLSEYYEDLSLVFDKVIIIDLIEMKLSPNYIMLQKYITWMKYTITKWTIFRFIEYRKVLFMDIDILPLNKDFYNVFEIEPPAIVLAFKHINFGSIISINEVLHNINKTIDYTHAENLIKDAADGGLLLIKPDIDVYNDYLKFIKICEGSEGYISPYKYGVDTSVITLFLFAYKKMTVRGVPYEYILEPWSHYQFNKDEVHGINFLSLIKPWVKIPLIQWSEENIWHLIANKSLWKSKKITKLYLNTIIVYIRKFYQDIKFNIIYRSPPFNMECVTIPKLKLQTMPILKRLINVTNVDDPEFIKDLYDAKKVSDQMDHKTLLDMQSLISIVNA